jgi:hypothetical protein
MSIEIKILFGFIFMPMLIAAIFIILYYLSSGWIEKRIDTIHREVKYCLRRIGINIKS